MFSKMKIFTILALFVTTIFVSSSKVSKDLITKIEGDYIQVYSNYYIQSTHEIDWRCVNASLKATNDEQQYINITKSAKLHGIHSDTIITINQYNLTQSMNYLLFKSFKESLQVRGLGPAKNGQYQYLILTGYNNMTMYVLARNFTSFMQDYNTNVRHILNTWDYTGTYKSPVYTYGNDCLPSQTK